MRRKRTRPWGGAAEESKARALSPDEVERILVVAEGTAYEALWVLLLTTGMRFGEVAGLTWGAVDLDAGIVRIEQAAGKRSIFLEQVQERPSGASSRTAALRVSGDNCGD